MKKKHPLSLWESLEVKELLCEFYEANFSKAGIPKSQGYNYVDFMWQNRNNLNYEDLRLEGNKRFSKFKDAASLKPSEINPLELLDLSNISKFLDIGSNKLATINYLQEKFSKPYFYGVDVIPQRAKFFDDTRAKYIQIYDDLSDYEILINSVDMVLYQFVLHHFKNISAIKSSITQAKKVLKHNGILVLFEECFESNVNQDSFKNAKEKGIAVDMDFTNRFYALDDIKKWEFITVNDWLINVSNPHMQWSFEYRSWESWVNLLDKFNFRLIDKFNLGLRLSGKLKQGVHMIGFFQKS